MRTTVRAPATPAGTAPAQAAASDAAPPSASGPEAPSGSPERTDASAPDPAPSPKADRAVAPGHSPESGPATAGRPRKRTRGGGARPIRLGARSVVALGLISAIGVVAFGWPLLADADSAVTDHAADAPWLFGALLPLLVAVVVATIADTGMGAKAVAMLGVLAAVGAALRPLGAGTAGLEPMFFLMVLSGRVLGPGFGFVLGSVTMFASALLTGGVGPWMPFQMLAMGWFTMGAGLLPAPLRLRGRGEVLMLAGYGCLASFAYGTVMNLQGWVLLQSAASSSAAFHPGAAVHENLVRFVAYCLATSLGWDLGRAALTVVLTVLLGSTVLKALRRATRRADFEAQVTFEPR
ncbi:ECF transporter S component [Streptomyces sp. PR69]|uniref:ECF transporter S component n=1 Tax=Streptomyces sp. PR69 TaxID=2984950 RepID=UPI003A5C6B6F